MRFLQLTRAYSAPTPDPAHRAKVAAVIRDRIAAGSILATGGLGKRATAAARVVRKEGVITVEDPPSGDGWMSAGGYSLTEFASKEDAIANARATLELMGDGELEIIQVGELHPPPRRADTKAAGEAFSLGESPVHLGLGATVVREPAFTGMDWYAGYGDRHAADGVEGRLVSMHTFTESWTSWEMHPKASELVVCTSGAMTVHQEIDSEVRTVKLEAGDAVINAPGVWHTADVTGECTALFITAGVGTEHRPR